MLGFGAGNGCESHIPWCLEGAFIQSYLQYRYAFSLVAYEIPWNRTHDLGIVSTLLHQLLIVNHFKLGVAMGCYVQRFSYVQHAPTHMHSRTNYSIT